MEEQRVRRMFERGRSRWPSLALSYEAFSALTQPHLEALADLAEEKIQAEDLFLVAACREQLPGAIDGFDALTWPDLKKHLWRMETQPERLKEVRQVLLVWLFVPDTAGATPRIARYTGRGPLTAWLRMSAMRLVGRARRKEDRTAPLADSYAERAVSLNSDIELSFIRGRYEGDFIAALRAALAALSDKQRLLLQFRYREEMTSDQIAGVLNTSRVTAHRRVVEARDALAEKLRQELRARLTLSDSGLAHLLGLLTSKLVPALTAELRDGLR